MNPESLRNKKTGTKFIHAGAEPDPTTGAIMTPIYQTSTYVQAGPAQHKGYEYARSQNPTRAALETALAVIENGKFGLAFSSGVAATDAVIKLLAPGDEVICANDMYGGTYRLFTKVFEKFGIKFKYVDTTHAENVTAALTANSKLIWIETPTNPLMNITDIAAIADISKKAGTILCVDNTFASPYLQNPLDLGADIVMHSSTKYLGGHSDVIQGALIMNDQSLKDQLYFIQKSCGAVPGPPEPSGLDGAPPAPPPPPEPPEDPFTAEVAPAPPPIVIICVENEELDPLVTVVDGVFPPTPPAPTVTV